MSDLDDRAKQELLKLTQYHWRERQIVLAGLRAKLGHYKRTGRLSYRYDVCPVCGDVGSTEQDPQCAKCYIDYACHTPFREGFRDDPIRGAQYFQDMYDYLLSWVRILLVGGDWNQEGGRPSKIVAELAELLGADLLNGGHVRDLPVDLPTQYKYTVWMANVPNEEPKAYPRKAKGGTLVVTKVMHEGVTAADAAERIFAMHGNAVIEISTDKLRRFRLADALNVELVNTTDLCELVDALFAFFIRAMLTRRMDSWHAGPAQAEFDNHELLAAVRQVADEVENRVGQRYFGNVSTRCTKTFPSQRGATGIWVSARNVDKQRIEADDMVLIDSAGDNKVHYYGDRKPSVDAPIQLLLYTRFPAIGCMLHGHAYVRGAPMTKEYFACGDLREVDEIVPLLERGHKAINLLNHGFLLVGQDTAELQKIVDTCQFENRL